MEPRKNTISECPHNLNIYDILYMVIIYERTRIN